MSSNDATSSAKKTETFQTERRAIELRLAGLLGILCPLNT